MILIPELLLGYQPIPKVATTSLIGLLYELCGPTAGPEAEQTSRPNAKRQYFYKELGNNRLVENIPQAVLPFKGYLRFALTRDPVLRFISMYSNRVLYHRELSDRPPVAKRIRRAKLPFDPDINLLVDNLEAYCAASPSIRHHSRPMMDFLGPSLSVFDHMVDISELPGLLIKLRTHWIDNDLAELAERCPPLARLQAGGPKLKLDVLSPASFEKLMVFYSDDYGSLSTLDAAKTRRAYEASRASAGNAAPPAATAPSTPAPARKWALEARFDKASAEKGPIGGVVVLSRAAPPGLILRLLHDGQDLPLRWGLRSPTVGKRYPNARNRQEARFRAARPESGGELTLLLFNPSGGKTIPIGRLDLGPGTDAAPEEMVASNAS
jgi:hypothetical protein